MIARRSWDALLFDLDGTLVDSAPEFVAAIAAMRRERGLKPPDAAAITRVVSNGARAMLRQGFPDFDDAETRLHDDFLARYRADLGSATTFYPGIEALLDALDAAAVPWGIVTNKPGWLTAPLLARIGLDRRAGAVVSGDTLPEKKPSAAPIELACRTLGISPARALMVGDDPRDVAAALGAGARAIVADWGYGVAPADAWGADARAVDGFALARLIGAVDG